MRPGSFWGVLATGLAGLGLMVSPAPAEDGELDMTFGTGGVLVTDVPDAMIARTAVQGDGRIIVAGSSDAFRVHRYLPDGSLDPSFGSGGIVSTTIGAPNGSSAADLVLQPDGRIVVAGWSVDGGGRVPTIARYLADGTLDPTFGTGGVVTVPLAIEYFGIVVALQADERLILAVSVGDSNDLGVLRFLPDGGLDPSFDGDGVWTLNATNVDTWPESVLVQPDGRIVLVAYYDDHVVFGPDTRVMRLAPNGSVDASYGSGGIVGIAGLRPGGATLLADGGVLIGGGMQIGSSVPGPSVVRLTATGALDAGFGDGGIVTSPGLGNGSFFAVLEQAGGRIVAAGDRRYFSNRDFLMARFEPDGSWDTTFARCAATLTNLGKGPGISAFASWDVLWDLVELPDGHLLAAGTTTDLGGNEGFALARYGTAPLPPCQSDVPTRSRVAYKSSRYKLTWKWRGTTSVAAFGDPLGATEFRFCVQDGTGAPIVASTILSVSGLAYPPDVPSWKATRTGFKFSGRAGLQDGVAKLVLSAPPDRESRLALTLLAFPGPVQADLTSPFVPPLTTHLIRNDDLGCFDATFSVPSKNEVSGFRASSD